MKQINCIYIVDDDPITVFGIKKMLGMVTDCNDIHTYENGKTALDSIIQRIKNGAQLPEVIFLDINMPIMDGWEFLAEFLNIETKEQIRINIISSSIDSADYEKWERYKQSTTHFIDYKEKPIFRIEPKDISLVNLAS
ncbi:MAG: response regulator [Bacteroidota bacterium]